MRIPNVLPFLDPEVRAKAPLAIEEMRKQGIWMVNAELDSITREDGKVCFHWKHAYRNRTEPEPEPESITTCI